MLPEYEQLHQLRLDRDWTFKQLSDAMQQFGLPLAPRTLNYLLTHETRQQRTRERTAHKVRQFLARVHIEGLPTVRRKGKRHDRRGRHPASHD